MPAWLKIQMVSAGRCQHRRLSLLSCTGRLLPAGADGVAPALISGRHGTFYLSTVPHLTSCVCVAGILQLAR